MEELTYCMNIIIIIFIFFNFCTFIYPHVFFSAGSISLFGAFVYNRFNGISDIKKCLKNKSIQFIGVILTTFFLTLTMPLILGEKLPEEYTWLLQAKLSIETIIIILSYSISEEFICRVWLEKIVSKINKGLCYPALAVIGILIGLHTFPVSLLMVFINIDSYLKEKNIIFIVASNVCFRLTAFFTIKMLGII